MSVENLLKQLCNYNEKDIVITGNPQITYNIMVYTKFRPHTNFSYGIITPEPTSKTTNTITWSKLNNLGDIINNIIICIDNIDDLSNIIISIDELEPIILTKEYIKIYNLICNKIIFQSDSGYLISFNPIHLIIYYLTYTNGLPQNQTKFTGLPTIITKINWICVSCVNPDKTKLKFNSAVLDAEERRKIADNLINLYKNQFNLESYEIIENNFTYWNLEPFELEYCGLIGCVISKSDYSNLESLELIFDGITTTITKSTIDLFNNFYDKIIFDYENNIIIKIKYLLLFSENIGTHILTYTKSSKYYLKINLLNDIDITNTSDIPNHKVYLFRDITLTPTNCLVVYTGNSVTNFINGYHEYKNTLTEIFNHDKQIGQIEISSQINLTHIKEIFIFFTNSHTNQKDRIANKFAITIADITNEYSTLDMDIYTQIHHPMANSDNKIYAIGFSIDPNNSYPNGLFNTSNKPISIEFDLMENINKDDLANYQINVVLFGFNVKYQ